MKKFIVLFSAFVFYLVGFSQVVSDFEINAESWHSEGDGDYLWESGVGNPGGCFRVNDDATGSMNRAYAPIKFLGDWSAATIRDYISADIFLHQISGGYVSNNFVFRISGPAGTAKALYSPIPNPPFDTWTTYSVSLDPVNWLVESGTWVDILQHVSTFIVTMEYIQGDEWNRMDNVTLSISPVQVPIEPGICSDFESGLLEGWSFMDVGGFSIVGSGGNPGRYLKVTDGAGTSIAVPSSIYHGNWSLLDGHNAEIHVDFSITNTTGTLLLPAFLVKLSGPGGVATYPCDNSIELAYNNWHSFGIPIEQAGWTMESGDWASLMNYVTDIQLAAEFYSGSEIVGIDNFCISNSPPVTDFSADKTFIFEGETVQFYDESVSAPQNWDWDFGDSGMSTDVNPTHQYLTPGFYSVSLTTTNHFGNSTESKTDYIEVYPIDQCLKFEDNFDNNIIHPGWSTVNGTWSEASGYIRQTSNYYINNDYLAGGCYALNGSLLWEDYIVSCDFRSTDNDYIGFVFNYQDAANMYMFRWSLQETDRKLTKYVGGVETVLASDADGYVENTWYHMDIYSIAGNLVISIDGIEIFSVIDNTFPNGKVGLYCWANQSSYFDNFKVECPGTPVDLSVFAEWPIVGTTMNTELNSENLLPVINPYTSAPWSHTGTEGVLHYSNPDVVDWVMVDFRDATSASNALAATSVETKAGLLLSDGQIISPYGGLPLFFNIGVTNSLYAVVWHRNHLGILSATPMVDFGGTLLYDFTTSANQAYGPDAQKDLGNGIFGMYAGDFNADGIINDMDKELTWEIEAGESAYIPSDCNLDGQADNLDKNDFWLNNLNETSQVPE